MRGKALLLICLLLTFVSCIINTQIVLGQSDTDVKQPSQENYATWSPDGKSIVFQSDKSGIQKIYTINIDGTGLREITQGLSRDFYPHWSPDGKSILFHSDRNGRHDLGNQDLDIYQITLDSLKVKPLITHSANDIMGNWSPDGTKIVFVSDRRADRDITNIYVYDLISGEVTNVSWGFEEAYDPAWSPDGTRIAFSAPTQFHDGLYDIFVVDINGENLKNLTSNSARHEFVPSWSPDGKSIMFQAGYRSPVQIYTIDVETEKVTQLTRGEKSNDLGRWSSDGAKIVFVSYRDDNGDIYMMDADGGNQKKVVGW